MQIWLRSLASSSASLAAVLASATGTALLLIGPDTEISAPGTVATFQGSLVLTPGEQVLLSAEASFADGRAVATYRVPRDHRALRVAVDVRGQGVAAYRATLGFHRQRPVLTLHRTGEGGAVLLGRSPVPTVGREIRLVLDAVGDRVRARASAPGTPAPAWQVSLVDPRALRAAGRPRLHVALGPDAASTLTVHHRLEQVVDGTRTTVPVLATPTPTPTSPAPAPCPLLGVYNDGNPDLDTDAVRQFGTLPQVANSYYQPAQRVSIAKETARIERGTSPNITITTKGTDLIDILGTGPTHPAWGRGEAWLAQYVTDVARLADVDPEVPVYATIEHEFKVKVRLGLLTGRSADPVVYGQALDRFLRRAHEASPDLRTAYWIAGSDRAVEGAVAEQLSELPRSISFDPYARLATDTVLSIVEADVAWIRAQPWFVGQEITISEFGVRVILGDEVMARFLTDVRRQLAEAGIAWAVYFNRERDDDTRIAERSDGQEFPLARAAFGTALQDATAC